MYTLNIIQYFGHHMLHICHLSDAYIKLYGSHCLRTLNSKPSKFFAELNYYDRRFDMNHAKEECSKNERCVGIESLRVQSKLFFNLCLDSIYKSLAWDRYENITNHLYKKVDTYGRYTQFNWYRIFLKKILPLSI